MNFFDNCQTLGTQLKQLLKKEKYDDVFLPVSIEIHYENAAKLSFEVGELSEGSHI